MRILPLPLALAAAAAAPAATPAITTAAPLDATLGCLRDALGGMGRVVTINTAGGAIVDLAFDSVAADGRPAQQHVTFAIEDLGTERQVKATAKDANDAALADQMLQLAAKTCLVVSN